MQFWYAGNAVIIERMIKLLPPQSSIQSLEKNGQILALVLKVGNTLFTLL